MKEWMVKLPFFVASWIIYTLCNTVLIALGYIMVPIALMIKDNIIVRESRRYPGRMVKAFKYNIFWIWGNEEEGIGYYGDADWSEMRKIFYSEVIRNPTNNLRFVPIISVKIKPEKIRFIGSLGNLEDNLSDKTLDDYDDDKVMFWSLTWHGWYSNIRVHFMWLGRPWRFWLGWKLYPRDINGLPEWEHRRASAGFATQFRDLI
jgi:hypothetical protein